MYLGIMAKRFIMSDALDGFGDRFAIDHASDVKVGADAETLENPRSQHLELNLSHEKETDLIGALVIAHPKQRILLLQKAKLRQCRVRVDFLGKQNTIAENGFENGVRKLFFKSQPVTGFCVRKPRDGTDGALRCGWD